MLRRGEENDDIMLRFLTHLSEAMTFLGTCISLLLSLILEL